MVQQIVYSIETSTPYLFITGGTIKPSMQTNFPGGAANTGAVPALDARLDVLGALQPEERD